MALYPVNQKKPNMNQVNKTSPTVKKTPPVKVKPIGFPTIQGDLGVIKIGQQPIPKQSKGPTATGNLSSKDSKALKKIMKKRGMLII